MSGNATIGEIRLFAGAYAPEGWLLCEGQELPGADFPGLVSVIGNSYGGTPGKTIRLPDLRARLVIGFGQRPGTANYPLAQSGGASQVQLGAAEIPAHNHPLMGTTNAPTTPNAGPGVTFAQPPQNVKPFNDAAVASGTLGAFSAQAIGPNATAGQPHDNIMPSLGLNYIIAVDGVLPN